MNNSSNKNRIRDILILCLIGLIPLLWFRGNEIILGHDAGLTLSPQSHFQDRLHSWTERFGFGSDQSYAIPGFFIHGLESLVSTIGFNVQYNQKITFIFWFLLPGLTMYYFASRLEKKYNLSHYALPVSVLYMVNHFLLQGWFVAERTKFSLYAALPLVLAFLFEWQENKQASTVKTALKIAVTFFFLNGLASIPLFGGVIVTLIAYSLFYFYESFSWTSGKRFIQLVFTTVIASIFLQAYWLLPYVDFLSSSYGASVDFFGGMQGVLGWIQYISQNSSFTNLFRLQGVPEWYQNPSHPYAGNFLNNPVLITVGYLIPIMAFLPLLLAKDIRVRKMLLFFSALALFSMIFIAGSHPPFGLIYIALAKYVPGFIAFRTPFYKFAPALWISYAILMGYTIQWLYHWLRNRQYLAANVFYAAVIAGVLLYSYPFLTGSFFDYIKGERSMRVTVPEYIYQYANWSDQKDNQGRRTLVLPAPSRDSNVEAYTWGYWSLAPLTTLLTNSQVINLNFYMSKTEKEMVSQLYKMIETNDPAWINLAQFLRIDTFVLRRDFAWDLKESPTKNPESYANFVALPELQLAQKFDKWEVYELKKSNTKQNRLTVDANISYYSGANVSAASSLPGFTPSQPLYKAGDTPAADAKILQLASNIYVQPKCIMCDLQWKYIDVNTYMPLLTRGSIFYPLIAGREQKEEANAQFDVNSKMQFYANRTLKNFMAFKKAFDEKENEVTRKAIIDEYVSSMDKFKKTMAEFEEKAIQQNDLLYDINAILHAHRRELINQLDSYVKKSENMRANKEFETLSNAFTILTAIQSRLDSQIWQTGDSIHKKFSMIIPQAGDYTMYYRSNENGAISEELNFSINDREYTVTPTQNTSNWYSLGSVALKDGLNQINLTQNQTNKYEGTASAELVSSYSGGCFKSNKIFGEKNDIFRIMFDQTQVVGTKDFFIGFISDPQELNPFYAKDYLNAHPQMTKYSTDFPVADDDGFYMIICDHPTAERAQAESTLRIENIEIIKLNIPEIIFHKAQPSKQDKGSISYTTNNTTAYQAELKNSGTPTFVTLHESFTPNWQIKDGSATKFMVNGYANGWLFESKKEGFITIGYAIENLVRNGFIVSGLSFGAIAIYLLVKRNKYEK